MLLQTLTRPPSAVTVQDEFLLVSANLVLYPALNSLVRGSIPFAHSAVLRAGSLAPVQARGRL